VVVSTLSHVSLSSSAANEPTTLLPGMCTTDNCLSHNYLASSVANKMNDLVSPVSNSPHRTETLRCMHEAGRNANEAPVSHSYN
jgi:hypothetical protein